MEIIDKILKADNYLSDVNKKDMIFIHHTAGGHRPDYVISGWDSDDLGRIATSYVIGGKSTTVKKETEFDGKIYRAFDDSKWAYHLGVKGTNGKLDKKSIGIEICNYGPVKLTSDGIYLNYVNKQVPNNMVYDLGRTWRGYRYFHKYTDLQIQALKELIISLSQKYKIDVKKQWDIDDFSVDAECLKGKAGLWTHVNCREDKTDCHPQPELIQMLNSL